MTDPRWGTQTELAIANFPIAGRPLDVRVARALAAIKRHAARVNAGLGVPGVDDATAGAIAVAARRVETGELDDQFPVDVFQTGSGTSTNMNVNEVLANLASEVLGQPVHPNDHVNASQSSNDTVPAAIRIAVAGQLVRRRPPGRRRLDRRLRRPRRALRRRRQGRAHPPHGRHTGDARPGGGRLGRAVARALARSEADVDALGELPLGGTAVGTGINAPPEFAPTVIAALAEETRLPLRPTPNPMVHQGGQGALAEASAGLRGIAVALTKIANDIRLLASGPSADSPSSCCPSCRPARRSCRGRSTRCCANQ